MKKFFITVLTAMALAVVIVLIIRGAGPLLVLFTIALALLLIFALGNPPRKRKDITPRDQAESVHRALGVQGAPDAEDLKPPDEPSHDEPGEKSR